MIDPKERELIQKAKNGDERSFEALIEGCSTRAYNIALRYLRNEEDAMDALQESFIKIFRHLDKFKEDSRFDTWVYRIVVNTCNDLHRGTAIQKVTGSLYREDEEGESMLEFRDSAPTPEEHTVRMERSAEILDCLEQIPADQREILILREIQGFSYEEIAEVLECSLGTVKSRINRARAKLRELILEQNLLS